MSTLTSSTEAAKGQRSLLVAVAGNPNSGKSTVFNALTGLKQRVGNYPGVTVEKRQGFLSGNGHITLLDLPGAYSLSANSPDEGIAREVLLGNVANTPRPDLVVLVIDATNLERNLFLATQVMEFGIPIILVCNMMDLVAESGDQLDTDALSGALGAPVVPTVARRGRGLDQVREAIQKACEDRPQQDHQRRWALSPEIAPEVKRIADVIRGEDYAAGPAAEAMAVLLLSEGTVQADDKVPATVQAAVTETFTRLQDEHGIDASHALVAARYTWLYELTGRCLRRAGQRKPDRTDRVDRVLTHRVWGLVVFAGVMLSLFYSMFTLAQPLMGGIESLVEGAQDLVRGGMPAGVLRDLITNGVLAGVGGVIVFFPQICILFLFLALLEDSGYMARAGLLMDRLMSRVGLHGKSFIPLLSSHACAVPGIMAARTIEHPRDRLVTIMVAPLMSCSARLPVYLVLIAACLPGGLLMKTGALFAMYALGIVAALAAATLFKKTLLKGPTPFCILELPPYRMPRLGTTLRVMWDRSKVFLTRVGTVILAVTVILWATMSYPKSDERAAEFEAERQAVQAVQGPEMFEQLEDIEHREEAANLRYSIAGRVGRFIEPAIEPLGYDWKIGIGILASFAAREVFVSTMGVVYGVGEADEESIPLQDQMQAATWPDGSKVYTPLVAVGLMVFYSLACQCASTLAVVRRETNSWRWPIFMFVYMSALAYLGALVVYQVGSALGLGTA